MGLIRALLGCRRGTAAVEAALLLPILVSTLLGMVEMTAYVEATRKAVSATQTVADLVAQDSSHTDATIQDIRNAATMVMYPLSAPTGLFDMTIASVGFDSSGDPELLWADNPATTPSVNVARAAGLGSANESVIMVTLTYTYDSLFGFLFESRTMREEAFARPRISRRIALNGLTEHDP